MPNTPALMPLAQLLEEDLQVICQALQEEFTAMAGHHLLITGGAGFLGYYLVQSVLHWNQHHGSDAPIHLTVFDNYLRGMPEWLEALRGRSDLTLVYQDLRAPLPPDMPPAEFIVHAAGIASPIYYRARPLECIDANINGLRNLLAWSVDRARAGTPVRGLLYFSSSEIYGDPPPDAVPTPETYRGNVSCTGPRACYDEAKRFGETLCVTYARHETVPAMIVRPFNNYGPGLKISDGRVIPDFARDVLAGRDIVMHSDGRPMRTFCYITDAVIGYYKLLLHGRSGEAYNIGIDQPEISIAQLAQYTVEAAAELFGYRGQVRHAPSGEADYMADNPNRRCPDISKARHELAFDPGVGVQEGLRRSLIWYAHNPVADAA